MWIYRSLFQLPRDVEDVRGGDEHDAESDGGVPSPVFRVREPPAVGGPDLRGVEPTARSAVRWTHQSRSFLPRTCEAFVSIYQAVNADAFFSLFFFLSAEKFRV